MKQFTLSLIFLVLLASCSTDNDERYDITTYYFAKQSKIALTTEDTNTFANIVYGENLVFKYNLIKADNPNIQDDEYSERLIFEIDPSVTEFTYNAEDIIQANAYFNQYCFCANIGSIPITAGTIQGTKINADDWLVSINISFEINGEPQSRSINKVFSNIATFQQSY
ncbi:hypothetical protein [Pontimicrobium sp. SW4]|uniref:Uncharacterized protein n=1 Tax=Pontimicrobium sp. SW4 TaxID=3153519 RepID=A0AAU7BP32_9FLAO